jgi:ParB-like chromosome segregation protein Spo0J
VPKPTITTLRITDLVKDPRNPRTRDERATSALGESLRRYGAGRGIVLDRNSVVVAGNGTLEAAQAAGIEEVLVLETTGRQLIATRRSDWSDREATEYSIADNRTGELAGWDESTLSAILGDLAADSAEAALPPGFAIDELQASLTKQAVAIASASEDTKPKAFETEERAPRKWSVALTENQKETVVRVLVAVQASLHEGASMGDALFAVCRRLEEA